MSDKKGKFRPLDEGSAVEVNNLPSEYPLPSAQVTTLTPPAAITGFATSAKQLADNHRVEVSNFPITQPISGSVTVSNPTTNPETGLATLAKQTTLESLIETLQELNQRLSPLAGAMMNTASLRVTGVAMPSTAVTGPATSANLTAALLVHSLTLTNDNRLLPVLANINNVSIT